MTIRVDKFPYDDTISELTNGGNDEVGLIVFQPVRDAFDIIAAALSGDEAALAHVTLADAYHQKIEAGEPIFCGCCDKQFRRWPDLFIVMANNPRRSNIARGAVVLICDGCASGKEEALQKAITVLQRIFPGIHQTGSKVGDRA
jgi:hypothetical protein